MPNYSPLFNDTMLAKYYSDMLQVSKLVVLVQLLSGQDTLHGASLLNLERIQQTHYHHTFDNLKMLSTVRVKSP